MLRIRESDIGARPEPGAGDLDPEIRIALAALEEVEDSYARGRGALERWAGPQALRNRLLAQLETRHARHRQVLVRRLADLHRDITIALLFRDLYRVR
jgi:hypothetical protein